MTKQTAFIKSKIVMLWAMMLALGTCEVLQPSSTENIRSAAIAIPHNLVANATQAKIF